MNNNDKFLGSFISYPSLVYGASEHEKQLSREQGDLFCSYIWGEKGISNTLKTLKHENYGNDMNLILFQFYVNPIAYELEHLKEIENYRKKEKSIGIPVIVNNENFFSKSEQKRFEFLKQAIFEKLDLLNNLIKKKKLDTNIELLKADLQKIL